MSFTNSFASLAPSSSASGTTTSGPASGTQVLQQASSSVASLTKPPFRPVYANNYTRVEEIPSGHRMAYYLDPSNYSRATKGVVYCKKYTRETNYYMPNAAYGCICPFPEARWLVHRCVAAPVTVLPPAAAPIAAPIAPKAMLRPSGKSKKNTRCASLLNKDYLVSYANRVKTGGPIARPKGRYTFGNKNCRFDESEPVAWIHQAVSRDLDRPYSKFKSSTKTYWHKGERLWKHKTYHPNPLDSDAYRQHHLGIQSDERGRIPTPATFTQILKKGKVNIPFIMSKNKLKLSTDKNGWWESTTSTSSSFPNNGSWGNYFQKTQAEKGTARGGFPSSEEGKEIRRVVDECKIDVNIWLAKGRLAGRYKDFSHKPLPKESIFDTPIDDRDPVIAKKVVRFDDIPITSIRYYEKYLPQLVKRKIKSHS